MPRVRAIPVENPPSPFERRRVEYGDALSAEELCGGEPPRIGLRVYEDRSRAVLSENRSPDLGFRWSVNAYRGCMHGCAYCYARPTHEYWGFGAGSDFERRIVVKRDAPELLRSAFARKSWRGELVVFSGNTDCYQPLEREYRLTRGLLEVCRDFANPCHIITKSALVERDLDVLCALHACTRLGVSISIPFANEAHARAMEPFVTTPARRLGTVRRLAAAGIPVHVMVSPVIPGLNDTQIPDVLEAAARAGARSASMTMVRLSGSVEPVFRERLERELPELAPRVSARIRQVRGGAASDARFGTRMTGTGRYAEAIAALFAKHARRLGLAEGEASPADGEARAAGRDARAVLDALRRRPSVRRSRQLDLFER